MAAETTGEPVMSNVIGICPPADVHVSKYILRTDHPDYRRLLFQLRLLFQRRDRITPDKWPRSIKPAVSYRLIYSRFRSIEVMAGPVMAVHTIHSTPRPISGRALDGVDLFAGEYDGNILRIRTRKHIFDVAPEMRLVDFASDAHQQNCDFLGTRFVIIEMADHLQLVVLRTR